VEDVLKLLDEYHVLKLDERGNIEKIIKFYDDEVLNEPFITLVSEEDKRKAAKLFLDALEKGFSEEVLRLKKEDAYGIFNVKMAKENEEIYVVAKELREEKPSFISDLLGNVIDSSEEWEAIQNKNIFDVVEEREKLMEMIRNAIDKGECSSSAFINEKKVNLRIKATTHLEFFVEEDIYRILESIMDAGNAGEIFEEMKNALRYLGKDFSLRLFDMEEGEGRGDVIHEYPIFRRGEMVGEIKIYEDVDDFSDHLLKSLSLISSKAVEKIQETYNILNDFAFYKIDMDGNILYGSSKFEILTGFSGAEIKGKNVKEFSCDRKEFFEELKKKGKVENFICKWKGKSKEFMACETAWRINGEIIVLVDDITPQIENEREVEFYNSLLRHDIFNKNEISLGYIGLLEKTNLTKKQKEFIEKIKESVSEANALIEKIRKAETIRRAEKEIIKVEINKVLQNICRAYEEKLKQKGVEISCEVADVVVGADEFVEEIFSNLIENSIQHSGCQKIYIYGERKGEFYVIHYEDDGKGVEKKYLSRIFEEGWKSESSGSGLGLYIVKKLMARYGGKAEAEIGEKGGLKINLYFKQARKGKKQEILKIRF